MMKMAKFLVALGFLCLLVSVASVAIYMHGDLGRDSDPVMIVVVASVLAAALCFSLGASRSDRESRRGGM